MRCVLASIEALQQTIIYINLIIVGDIRLDAGTILHAANTSYLFACVSVCLTYFVMQAVYTDKSCTHCSDYE